jgi:endonuclease YncB( thermonuclease family)
MSKPTLRNTGGVPFLILKGNFVIRQRHQPDGDTIHFAASSPFSPGPVISRVPVSSTGIETVAVRFQSIDAPEKKQPMGAASRDAALRHIKIKPSDIGLSDDDFTANGPIVKISGWLATHGIDGNKRQLGYVFPNNPGFTHGAIVSAEKLLAAIKKSTNYHLVAKGWAYPAFYDNTDEMHATIFQQAASRARSDGNGIWKDDRTTTGFVPTKTALGVGGALVYPKFFRRVDKWRSPKPNSRAFIKWLKIQKDGKKWVEGAHSQPIRLWQLFESVGVRKVRVPYDVTRLWFSE